MFGVGGHDVTGSDPQQTAAPAPEGSRSWRRRQFVVDARYQLRAGALVGAVAISLLVLLNVSLISQDRHAPSGGRPASRAVPDSTGPDRTSWALLLLGSGVFVVGVIAIGVLESHRTAGAAYAIRRSIEQIREGRTGVRVRLRRGDHLQDLAAALNLLAESLDAERTGRG
jgi:hypothetical protein